MKLYKYRSLGNVEFTLDILLNKRLHCAPFEGLFMEVMHSGILPIASAPISTIPRRTFKSLSSVSKLPIPGNTHICSLSASLSDVRMWSHYANGHTGIAIEFEIDAGEEQLYKIEYIDKLKERTYENN